MSGIARQAAPVFVTSGTADRHTIASETQQLFARAGEPKRLWLVDGAAHVNLHGFAPAEYAQRISEFFGG